MLREDVGCDFKAEVKGVRHGIDAESFAAILVKDNRRNARSPLDKKRAGPFRVSHGNTAGLL